ncbi:MAG: ATPase, T2SS/T4P/T4SS family, partial [Candidatus Gracilibacteria bacterium]
MADSTPQSATVGVTNGASATTPPTVAVTTPTIQQIAPTLAVTQPSQPMARPSASASTTMSSSAAVAPQPTANSSAAQSTAGTSAVSDNLFKINRDLKEKAVKEQAARFGYGYIDIEKIPINPDLASIFYESEAIKALCIPFFRVGKKLRVALFDPKKEETVQLLESLKQKGYLLNINLASDEGIKSIIDRLYAATRKYAAQEIVTQVSEADIQAYEKEIQNLGELKNKLQTITSEEALNLINVGAIKTGASDIHIQPEEKNAILRFRIDGVLQKIFEMDLKIFANITNQLKYKSGMKLNITNVPQDGRFYFVINQRKIDVRVSALPTEFGETFVLRLLDSGKGFLAFDQCGFIGRNLELMNKSVQISHGMILATGPTGSGKTTTLYSLLNQFNSPQVKIITLEDPIEYHLPGISQSQINEKRGYNFADGLRSILRQDP